MKYWSIFTAAALFALTAAGMPALAGEQAPPGGSAPYVLAFDDRPGGGGAPLRGKREEAMKKVEMLKKWRLIEELDLDEKTADGFLPLLSSIESQRREAMKERMDAMRGLKETLNSQSPDERKIKQGLERVESAISKLGKLREKEINAAREHLTYEQQARYLIFNQEFEREMRRIISRARGRQGGPIYGGQGREGGPMYGGQGREGGPMYGGQGREGGPMYGGQGREGEPMFGGPEGGRPPFPPGGQR